MDKETMISAINSKFAELKNALEGDSLPCVISEVEENYDRINRKELLYERSNDRFDGKTG
ncbi:MAG: hypothetical protein K6E62_06555 [Lachnospiraceae bacterium]|nr:hypothetical protein [Lachnospiraceae bacterium]